MWLCNINTRCTQSRYIAAVCSSALKAKIFLSIETKKCRIIYDLITEWIEERKKSWIKHLWRTNSSRFWVDGKFSEIRILRYTSKLFKLYYSSCTHQAAARHSLFFSFSQKRFFFLNAIRHNIFELGIEYR